MGVQLAGVVNHHLAQPVVGKTARLRHSVPGCSQNLWPLVCYQSIYVNPGMTWWSARGALHKYLQRSGQNEPFAIRRDWQVAGPNPGSK